MGRDLVEQQQGRPAARQRHQPRVGQRDRHQNGFLLARRAFGGRQIEIEVAHGEVAVTALARRQFYVGNTRYRGAHAIYLSDKDKILRRLATPDPGRELATEFTARHGIVFGERHVPRPVCSMNSKVRAAWRGITANLRGHRAGRAEQHNV